MANSKLYFPHIPKSAGTSFRNAFENQYGTDKVLRDYSASAPETTPNLFDVIYQDQDFYALKRKLETIDFKLLAGHFPAAKYAKLFPLENMVTFVREPIARLVSEYKHFVRHRNYKGSLTEFVRKPENINKQARLLKNLPISSIGFIGVTEQYQTSLEMFSHQYDINIPLLNKNIAPKSQGSDLGLSDSLLEEIKKINAQDLLLYAEVVELHDKRYQLFQDSLPYTLGQFHISNGHILQGWAYQIGIQTPIKIGIHWEGKLQHQLVANKYNMLMDSLNSPRAGHIGFNIKVPENVEPSSILCINQDTLQPLVNRIS
ncbi:sulfotransferase family 2 domain-containing protein [Shewanella waksmanii]|uniref:sulfotransferase family 2 domain-containing protein n=1 Tax=Shewanella waksmanii TaxID=213783 RepID=UPI00048D1720|nr:sulfotransferase family 2 domain-containing protein [Shewanella waksmanii]